MRIHNGAKTCTEVSMHAHFNRTLETFITQDKTPVFYILELISVAASEFAQTWHSASIPNFLKLNCFGWISEHCCSNTYSVEFCLLLKAEVYLLLQCCHNKKYVCWSKLHPRTYRLYQQPCHWPAPCGLLPTCHLYNLSHRERSVISGVIRLTAPAGGAGFLPHWHCYSKQQSTSHISHSGLLVLLGDRGLFLTHEQVISQFNLWN